MNDEVKNGAVLIAETEYHKVYACRTDMMKFGINIFDVSKHILNVRFSFALELLRGMTAAPSPHVYARIDDIETCTPAESGTPNAMVDRAFAIAEIAYAKAAEKGWLTAVSEEALQTLREASPENGFAGITPGR